MVLLSGSSLATVLSLAYNIVIGWYLGPKSFGHATVVYSLLVLLSAVSFAFQIVTAKVVAQQPSAETKAEVYRCFHRSAIGCGISVALVLFLFRQGITDYLNLPDSSLIAMLAVAAGFYIPLGARRGYDQGSYRFHRLAMSLVIEGAVRLGGSYGLVAAGYGVQGVVAANAVAMAVSYFAMTQRLPTPTPNPVRFWDGTREIGQALLFYSGQMIINNCDLVVVKHIFPAREAGLYAAVGLVGRVIFVLSAAVVNSTFPIVAGTRAEERKDLRLIATPLFLVLGIGSLVALAMWIAPPSLWTTMLGPGFQIAGKYDIPYLSALYALKTVVYSISAVVITFEMAHKIANTSWIQLLFSGMLIAGIYQFHSSLHQVILVQLAVLSVLFVVVAIPFLIDALATSKIPEPAPDCCPVSLLRPVTENEVIAEFLNSDLNHPDFRDLNAAQGHLSDPNPHHTDAIARRHALLLAKRRSLWEELPRKPNGMRSKSTRMALTSSKYFRGPNGESWHGAITQSSESSTALLAVMVASAIMIVMLPICGRLSDRIGRRKVFGIASLLIGVLSFPAFWLMGPQSPLLTIIAVAVPFALVYPAVYGPEAALFSELFDTRVRYTGISFVYQFSGIFASGLTPIVATALLPLGGGKPWLICLYILVVSAISALSVYAMTDRHESDIAVDQKKAA